MRFRERLLHDRMACELAVRLDGALLALVPKRFRTLDVCALALGNAPEGRVLPFVPEDIRELLGLGRIRKRRAARKRMIVTRLRKRRKES